MLVASLKLDTSAPLVSSTLKAFTEMLQNSDEETDKKLIEYCYDIVPQLVKLAGFPGNMVYTYVRFPLNDLHANGI